MLNCSYSRISCVLCTFGDQHNKVMFCKRICSHDKPCSFIEVYSAVKQGSVAFELDCVEVFCDRILNVYKCGNSHRVLLSGHKISLIALLATSFSCGGCSGLSARLCLIQRELNKTVLSHAFLGSQWFAVFTQNLRGPGFLMVVP